VEECLAVLRGARMATSHLGCPAAILPIPPASADDCRALRKGLEPAGAIFEDPRHARPWLASETPGCTAIRWDEAGRIETRDGSLAGGRAAHLASDLAWILRVPPAPEAGEAIERALG